MTEEGEGGGDGSEISAKKRKKKRLREETRDVTVEEDTVEERGQEGQRVLSVSEDQHKSDATQTKSKTKQQRDARSRRSVLMMGCCLFVYYRVSLPDLSVIVPKGLRGGRCGAAGPPPSGWRHLRLSRFGEQLLAKGLRVFGSISGLKACGFRT